MTKPDISNLSSCIEDARKAALDSDTGPVDPTNYSELRDRLEASRDKLPPLYQEAVFKPFLTTLDKLGPAGFADLLLRDPDRRGPACLMMDIAHAILQNGEGYCQTAIDAFQEVVSDLYDGFLSAEDRKGVKPPEKGAIAPLVKWGNPASGPYTWPVDATAAFGLKAGVVNLPPANARTGLFAWAALGHETGGHDILHADTGLSQELARAIHTSIKDQKLGQNLAEYWSARIDETASDVMGILNMGPAAGIGVIGYFRGLNAAYTGKDKLRSDGPAVDPHPADIMRGYLAAAAVSLLDFDGVAEWAGIIEAETAKDLTAIHLGGKVINSGDAKDSAQVAASTIVGTKLKSLENHSLGEIQNWHNQDEEISKQLWPVITAAAPIPAKYPAGIYAAHVVAAAVTAAVSRNADISVIFNRMLTILKTMNDVNPSWGPLYVEHPGNLVARTAYSSAFAARGFCG